VKIFLQEAGDKDSRITVLLLHGMSFSSANWVKSKTVASIAAMGHHVVAVDLPGQSNVYFTIFMSQSDITCSQ
jgi:pimeloyl-ACP methyl ester carboxylesterase